MPQQPTKEITECSMLWRGANGFSPSISFGDGNIEGDSKLDLPFYFGLRPAP